MLGWHVECCTAPPSGTESTVAPHSSVSFSSMLGADVGDVVVQGCSATGAASVTMRRVTQGARAADSCVIPDVDDGGRGVAACWSVTAPREMGAGAVPSVGVCRGMLWIATGLFA